MHFFDARGSVCRLSVGQALTSAEVSSCFFFAAPRASAQTFSCTWPHSYKCKTAILEVTSIATYLGYFSKLVRFPF